MTTRRTNVRAGVSRATLTGLAILTLTFITTAANASCFDHGRGASPAVPKELIAQLAASPSAAHGTIVGLWHVTYTTSDNQPFQESFDMWHSDGLELESANINPIEGNTCIGVWKQIGSFTAGGVTLATGTLDRTPPPPISPLYGAWQRAGHNTYATSLSFFIFDEAGNAIAMLQNYETFQLNANHEIVGTGEAYICDTNGDNCAQVESLTFTGKRLNAQHS